MRCTACSAELILTNVVPDDTVAVRGVEHHTFVCPACHITERRVVFTRHGREDDGMPVPVEALPRILPSLPEYEEQVTPAGLLGRVMARLRGH